MTGDSRRTVSSITLAVTAVVVVVMAVWGFNAATAPIDDDGETASVSEDQELTCGAGEVLVKTEVIRRAEVTVSVYNAGKKSGRAGSLMTKLEGFGFKAGDVGNAPEGSTVAKAEVHTKGSTQDAARLVAAALGKGTPVIVDEDTDLGPGIDVYIGDGFRKLDKNAPRQVKLAEPDYDCV